jgi:hypothetical protein
VHIQLETGETITATAGHPLKTTEGWRDAILLKRGGKLLLKGGDEKGGLAQVAAVVDGQPERTATIADVRTEQTTVRVFNLEVANAHTFFVGDEGALTHNGKRGPKPGLEGPHNQTIDELAELIESEGGIVEAGGRRRREELIPTPGGKKCARRPDIIYRDRLGTRRGINVGKQDRHGNPIPREQDALNDLNGPGGLPTRFTPYN